MNLNGADLVDVKEGVLAMSTSNVATLANGAVTVSYANGQAVNAGANDVLFTLVVKANTSTSVANMLSINSNVLSAESYVGDLQVGKVSLNVRTAPVAGIELFQNEPNPFKDFTNVNFDMPSAAAVTITVTDVTGKLLAVKNVDAVRGANTVKINRSDVGATGIMFYTLTSGDFTATKKMIIVE
jgi:Secretion system C-terminal sorting domain